MHRYRLWHATMYDPGCKIYCKLTPVSHHILVSSIIWLSAKMSGGLLYRWQTWRVHALMMYTTGAGMRQWVGSSLVHYNDVIMGAIASQITSLTIAYSTVHPDADQRKHQSSASLAFVRGIHRWPVNSPHKWSVTLTMFPFDDVIMSYNG